MEQIGWVLHHLADLESDFSRFHGITDMYSMPGPRFFQFAWRIAAYDGMMARRVEAQRDRGDAGPAGESPTRTRSTRATSQVGPGIPADAEVVPLAAMSLTHGDLFEITRAPRTE